MLFILNFNFENYYFDNEFLKVIFMGNSTKKKIKKHRIEIYCFIEFDIQIKMVKKNI